MFWFVEMLIPATMALFGLLTARAGYKRAGRALVITGAALAVATVGVKLWAPLAPAMQSMADVAVQLLVFLLAIAYVNRNLKNEKK